MRGLEDGALRVLYDQQCIAARVRALGEQITRDYEGACPLLVCVLRGSYVFAADLSRAIDLPVEIDFVAVSSYGDATRSSGVVRLLKDLDTPIAGRDVIVVEDVVDSGLTLEWLVGEFRSREPRSLRVVTLLLKNPNSAVLPDYVGFDCPDDYVVGYGLDHAQKYRNLPCIGVLDFDACTL